MSPSLLPDMDPIVQGPSNSALFAWLTFKSVPIPQFHARSLQLNILAAWDKKLVTGPTNVPDT